MRLGKRIVRLSETKYSNPANSVGLGQAQRELRKNRPSGRRKGVNGLDEKRNAAPGGQPDTARKVHVGTDIGCVNVDFEIKELNDVLDLISRHYKLCGELMDNARKIRSASIQLNARVSGNPIDNSGSHQEG